MTGRCALPHSLPPWGTTVAPRHGGGGATLIHKHQSGRIETADLLPPALPTLPRRFTVLFLRVQGFFYAVAPNPAAPPPTGFDSVALGCPPAVAIATPSASHPIAFSPRLSTAPARRRLLGSSGHNGTAAYVPSVLYATAPDGSSWCTRDSQHTAPPIPASSPHSGRTTAESCIANHRNRLGPFFFRRRLFATTHLTSLWLGGLYLLRNRSKTQEIRLALSRSSVGFWSSLKSLQTVCRVFHIFNHLLTQ